MYLILLLLLTVATPTFAGTMWQTLNSGSSVLTEVPTMEEVRAAGKDQTGASSVGTAPCVCDGGGTDCTDRARRCEWTSGGIPIMKTFNSSNAATSDSLTVYPNSDLTIAREGQSAMITFPHDENVVEATAIRDQSANPADAGFLMLGNAVNICWEASPAGTDVCMNVNTSELFTFTNGFSVTGDVASTTVTTGAVSATSVAFADGSHALSAYYLMAQGGDSASTPEYMWMGGTANDTFTTTNNASSATRWAAPFAGTITEICCVATGTPAGGVTWTQTVQKGGSNQSMALACTAGACNTQSCSTANPVSFVKGNEIGIEHTDSSATDTAGTMQCQLKIIQ